MSYVYHAMSAYFDRDNVALPGMASYFRDASEEERTHAQELMDFQVKHRPTLTGVVLVVATYNYIFYSLVLCQHMRASTKASVEGAVPVLLACTACFDFISPICIILDGDHLKFCVSTAWF